MTQSTKFSLHDKTCDQCEKGIDYTSAKGWDFCTCPRGQAAKSQARENETEQRITAEETRRMYEGI